MNYFKQLRARMAANREEGAALVIAIILLSAIEILGFGLITMTEIDYNVANNLTRSEEALYAAEQGVAVAMDMIHSNRHEPPVPPGTSANLSSRDYRGRTATQGSDDPNPRWEVTIRNTGSVEAVGGGQSLNSAACIYRIMSVGFANRGVTKTIVVEAAGNYSSMLHEHGGKKLATTSY